MSMLIFNLLLTNQNKAIAHRLQKVRFGSNVKTHVSPMVNIYRMWTRDVNGKENCVE